MRKCEMLIVGIVLAVIAFVVCGCEEAQQRPQVLENLRNPTENQRWVSQYGDGTDSALVYNIKFVDVFSARQRASMYAELKAMINDPNDPNSIDNRLRRLEEKNVATGVDIDIEAPNGTEEPNMYECAASPDIKICPITNRAMIKRYTGVCLTSYPAQYPWYWWCGCGHTEEGGVETGKTLEQLYREEWEKINKGE